MAVPITILGCQYETTGYGEEIRAIILNLAKNPDIDLRTIDLPVNFDRLRINIEKPKGSLLAYRFPDGIKYYDTTLPDSVCAKLTHLLLHPTCGFPDHEYYQRQIYEPHGMLMIHCSPIADDNERFTIYSDILRKYPYLIGRTTFETSRIQKRWVDECNKMDEIHVQSEFNKKAFEESGVKKPIYVFPCGSNPKVFKYRPKEYITNKNVLRYFKKGMFNFVSIFEAHFENIWRKGLDVLLKGYLRAFSAADLVNLSVKTNLKQNELDILVDRANKDGINKSEDDLPSVTLVKEYYTIEDLATLYNVADAFVLPSRGEGLGIPYLEAMFSGCPTIGTRFSGNVDFMNDDNSILVEVEEVFGCNKKNFPSQSEYWDLELATPSFEDLAVKMRDVFENIEEYKNKIMAKREEVSREWSSENKVGDIARRVLEISGEKGIEGDPW